MIYNTVITHRNSLVTSITHRSTVDILLIYMFIYLNVTHRMRQPLIASTQNTIMSVVDTFGVRNGFYPFFLLSCACTQHMWS